MCFKELTLHLVGLMLTVEQYMADRFAHRPDHSVDPIGYAM